MPVSSCRFGQHNLQARAEGRTPRTLGQEEMCLGSTAYPSPRGETCCALLSSLLCKTVPGVLGGDAWMELPSALSHPSPQSVWPPADCHRCLCKGSAWKLVQLGKEEGTAPLEIWPQRPRFSCYGFQNFC